MLEGMKGGGLMWLVSLSLLALLPTSEAIGGASGVSGCSINNGGCGKGGTCTEDLGNVWCTCTDGFTGPETGPCLPNSIAFSVDFCLYGRLGSHGYSYKPVSLTLAHVAEDTVEQAFLGMSLVGKTPIRAMFSIIAEDGSFQLVVSVAEETTPQEQADIYEQLGAALQGLEVDIGLALNTTTVLQALVVEVQCGPVAMNISLTKWPKIESFLNDCACDMAPRKPTCSPMDMSASFLSSLIDSVEFLVWDGQRQDKQIDVLEQQVEDLEDMVEMVKGQLGSMQDQIEVTTGADTNLSRKLMAVDAQLMAADLELGSQIQALQGLVGSQQGMIDDMDSKCDTTLALGIAGTVLGALAIICLATLCTVMCCPGCLCAGLTGLGRPQPGLLALPRQRPAMAQPVMLRQRQPFAFPPPRAMFGAGRMKGPLYGSFYH